MQLWRDKERKRERVERGKEEWKKGDIKEGRN